MVCDNNLEVRGKQKGLKTSSSSIITFWLKQLLNEDKISNTHC